MSLATRANGFAVKTEVFEGPLELLIELVEKRKLLINDISLAEVTDEYLRQVAAMQERSLPGTANFVALAATLLLIKSKSLLPSLSLTTEEEESIENLESRLQLYQIYREAAKTVAEKFGQEICQQRQFITKQKSVFVPDSNCELSALREAMMRVLADLPQSTTTPRVKVKPVITLEEMIDRIHSRIEKQAKLSLSELVADKPEKTTVIVGFLAVLESVRQGRVLVAQTARFEDIEIEVEGPAVPKY